MKTQAEVDAKVTQAVSDAAAETTVTDSFVSMLGDILSHLAEIKGIPDIGKSAGDAIGSLFKSYRDRAEDMVAAMVVTTPAHAVEPGGPRITPEAAKEAAKLALANNPLPPSMDAPVVAAGEPRAIQPASKPWPASKPVSKSMLW